MSLGVGCPGSWRLRSSKVIASASVCGVFKDSSIEIELSGQVFRDNRCSDAATVTDLVIQTRSSGVSWMKPSFLC